LNVIALHGLLMRNFVTVNTKFHEV